jgi:phage shock protein PspC (stress-responsive transcriptional regulator)
MTRQTLYTLIFNAVGVLIGLTVIGYVINSLVFTETEPSCSARYPAPMRFSLHTRHGAAMSPIELQARVGLNEWGINENAHVVEAAEAPGGAALAVKLATVPEVESGNGRPANGVSFRWTPAGVRNASAACLSYELWLPDDFAFGDGGLLPGPFGGPLGAATSDPSSTERFAARVQWRRGDEGSFDVASTGATGYLSVNQRGIPLPKGRWMRIEQELVLNTPGEADGVVRMWLDGALKAESTHMALRKDESEKILGVLAGIGYFRAPAKPGMLRIGPFELAWK